VLKVGWDRASQALSGSVIGQDGLYRTTAHFAEVGARLVLQEGRCSCPVGYDCKHVAAITIVAAATAPGGEVDDDHAPLRQPRSGPSVAAATPAWEAPLRALFDDSAEASVGLPLAIELTLQAGGPPDWGGWKLLARLMRQGRRGSWVNGSLSWNGLDSWQLRQEGFRDDHLDLVHELHAAHRARDDRSSYFGYSRYGSEKTIDLAACGPQLWPLLEEAGRVGLVLLDAHGGSLEEVPRPLAGEVLIDVTRAGAGLEVRARFRIGGEDPVGMVPRLFLGSTGHGLVCTSVAAGGVGDGGLRLVRLARPVTPQLRGMVLQGKSLRVPARDVDRFSQELCPALQRVAPVESSDGSFAPPAVSGPSLVLRARYGDAHILELGWEWAYEVGQTTRHLAPTVGPDPSGLRDLAAERAILAGTALTGTSLEDLGLVDERGHPVAGAAVVLRGIDSMRFTTEQLPELGELAGVSVEIDGEPADYRDVADSLEIGVSATEVEGERDWFDLGVTIAVEGRTVPFAEVFLALAGGASHMVLDDGAYFSLEEARLQSLRELIEEARSLVDSPSALPRISRYQAGLWGELAAIGVVSEQAEAWQRQIGQLLELDTIVEYVLPATLHADLRPYQREGFAWLAMLWDLGIGGVLADDMGLGKTLQALALICHAKEQAKEQDAEVGPFLVVAPTSVVPGWVSEAAQFAPSLRVEAVADTLSKSGRAIGDLAAADVVVSTYTLLRLDAEAYGSVRWAGVILDEAQAVKNHQGKTYRAVRELAATSKIALTGTPMENNLMELWSLLSITAPGLFPDPKRFTQEYARPIERGGDAERLDRLRRRIRPLVKRRTKELVAADLPAKQEQTLEIELHPRHRKLYDMHLQRERQRVLGLLGDFDRNRFTILRSITLLRQLSLHPGLVDADHDAIPSAKLAALTEQLEDVIGGGHRALVFSQFTSYLAKVRDVLDREGIGYCYLDGRTRHRGEVIDRFRSGDDPVFLISLKAGGSGLNLTEADYCFLLDPWWNPAVEHQAIDRTHRIGQTRPVMVYRMVARDTIEEKVVALARRKDALFRGVMDEGDLFASRLTAEDIRGLFS
jgi:superfamily II DNA or RNA helicase